MRRDKKAVSPVVGTVLMVSITVVLAATLWVMVSQMGMDLDAPEIIGVLVQDTPNHQNWRLLFVSVSANIYAPSSVFLTVSDASGRTTFPTTSFVALSGITEAFIANSPQLMHLATGDSILLSKFVYPSGSVYTILSDTGSILARGTLK